jgi:UDP-N-acetylmuramoyl-tripeptide--D-alanyl-D-alanine ligase
MDLINIFTHIILVMSLGWYMITNLQWYNYKLERVLLKHHKLQWHIVYFLTPFALFYILEPLYYNIYFYLLYLTSFVMWNRSLDKPLVLTQRVQRFLAILLFTTFAVDGLCLASNQNCATFGIVVPLFIAYGISMAIERVFFLSYKDKAQKRLNKIKDLKIIAITASYGKTSIKNYLYQVLQKKYKTYMTPRSVNTLAGIVKDVNEDLPLDTQIYIAEAGAREKGDIEEITKFLNPQYAVIGSVGEQHIEYFKTLDNIIHTKMEILQSGRLAHGFVHDSVPILKYPTITPFPQSLNVTKSNLDGIWFDVEIDGSQEHFHAPVLGSFNATNLTAVVLCAYQLGMKIDEIKIALHNLKPVEHRLQLIRSGGKIIIDDSFNGNLDGMLEAVNLASTYKDRRVIVTPGIVESTVEANVKFAKAVDDIFDIVIITGTLNANVLSQNLKKPKVYKLSDKSQLESTLARETKPGDLILFANDAPSFI